MRTTQGRGSLVLFGAGSIGRSFIGQLFARNGYEVVFVDVDRRLVESLNIKGGYEVVVKETGRPDVVIPVTGVRGILAENRDAVSTAVARADYVATAVGKAALPRLAPVLAEGIAKRGPEGKPLDIILAENARDAGTILRAEVEEALGRASLEEHIENLVRRFANRALGDTVYRVGRDLPRKLSRDDRVVGAMLLTARWKLGLDTLAEVYSAALEFQATDVAGTLYSGDRDFHRLLEHAGLEGVLREVSRLDESNPIDRAVIESIRRRFYRSGRTTSAPSEA